MREFNKTKIHWRAIKTIELLLLLLMFPFRILKKLLPAGRPCVILADGFQIGDAVFMRPLLKALLKRYGATHRILAIAGRHSDVIWADIPGVGIIHYQFPWALYDYSAASLFKTIAITLRLYFKNVSLALEPRGDFRNIAWLYLTCPGKLVGFGYTGGRRLLDAEAQDSGKIEHIARQVFQIADYLGLEASVEDIAFHPAQKPEAKTKRIGVSFCGTQPLRLLPQRKALEILDGLAAKNGVETVYIMSPARDIFEESFLKERFGGRIRIFSGGFREYFELLETLSLYIGMDSGGGHICAMLRVPSVIIFGSKQPFYCKPLGEHPLLCAETREQLSCRPCDGAVCTNNEYKKCLNTIDAGEILKFCDDIISGAAR